MSKRFGGEKEPMKNSGTTRRGPAAGGLAKKQKVTDIKNLDELEKLLREPLYVNIPLGGGLVRLECQRLKPFEAVRVERILNAALPPIVPAEDGQGTRYDITDPEYLDKKAVALNQARAMTVYLACPLYRQKFPNLETPEQVAEAVNSVLTEEVLRLIANTVASEDGLVPRMANFF